MQTDAGAVEGLAPAFDLPEFVSRFTPLTEDGAEFRSHCPFCDAGNERSLCVGAGWWKTYCCNSDDLNGGDHIGFYACWTNSTRAEAAAALGNGAGLPDAKPVTQVPLKRLPFWGWRYLDKLPGKAVWIHELSGAVLVWRKLVPERVHLGLIHSGKWDNLSIVAGRKVVLVPENNPAGRAKMQLLAAALYRAGHEKVMCLSLGLDPEFGTRELPPPGEDVIKWAKARSKPYPKPGEDQKGGQDAAELPSALHAITGVASVQTRPNAAPESEPVNPLVAPATPERLEEAAPFTPEELHQFDEQAVRFAAAKVAEIAARVAQNRAQEAASTSGNAPAIDERHSGKGNGRGTPLTPPQRVKAQEQAARAEVLAGLVYTCIANVRPEAVRWLWPGRIPLGELTMIVGDPGLGKSQICASLASVVTNGGQWPVDRNYAEQGSVLILSAEDNIKHTIRPRLDAANADVSRCHTLQAVKRISEQGIQFEAGFNLAEDVAKLSVLMDEIGDVRLVVIDPVSAYLGETDSHKNAEVRGMLAPLTTLAGNHNAAIILVSHLTKSQSANALMRVQGSIAFAALCRAVWGVTADKDNRQRRLFMPLKNNLGQDKTGLAYAIESAILDIPDEAGEPIPTSKVMWESELVETSVDEAFGAALSHDERTEMDEAKDFLREALAEGRVKASEVQRLSNSAGHSNRTLMRAKKALKVTSEREGFTTNAIWFWKLPEP